MISQFLHKPRMHVGRLMIVLVGMGFWSSLAAGQFIVNFDENGVGSIQIPGNVPIPLLSLGNITDPIDPGNGLKPLAYSIVNSLPGVVPVDGDINLIDNTGLLSDLIRWEHGLLVVYSDLNEPGDPISAADVGFAPFRQTNVINMQETGPDPGLNGMFNYLPAAGGPGQISAPTIYNFTSDSGVPEPGSIALLAVGAGSLLMRRRRRS